MGKGEDRRVKLTNQMLKDALTQLLERKDIYHIAVREICDTADVNRSTFYKHYGSQFDLLTDMENDMLSLVEESITKNSNSREKIIEDACRFLECNIRFARLLLNNNVDPSFPQKLFSLTSLRDAVSKLTRDSHPGLNRNGPADEYTFNYVIHGAYQVIRVWINKEDREKPEEFADILCRIIV